LDVVLLFRNKQIANNIIKSTSRIQKLKVNKPFQPGCNTQLRNKVHEIVVIDNSLEFSEGEKDEGSLRSRTKG
jgi:hypothetical protein